MENSFGSLIDRERNARRWTYERLSEETEKCGHRLSSSYIYRLVKGKQNEPTKYDPTTKTVKVLMEALNLDINEVLKALNMEQYVQDLYNKIYNQPIDLKSLLLKANVIIQTDSVKIKISKGQKEIINELVNDLYKAALQSRYEELSYKANGHAERLQSLISHEKYVIALEDGEINLDLNVKVMIENYGIQKEDILNDLKNLDVKALNQADSSIPLFFMNEDWLCEREKSTIIVKDKISELRKKFQRN